MLAYIHMCMCPIFKKNIEERRRKSCDGGDTFQQKAKRYCIYFENSNIWKRKDEEK